MSDRFIPPQRELEEELLEKPPADVCRRCGERGQRFGRRCLECGKRYWHYANRKSSLEDLPVNWVRRR